MVAIWHPCQTNLPPISGPCKNSRNLQARLLAQRALVTVSRPPEKGPDLHSNLNGARARAPRANDGQHFFCTRLEPVTSLVANHKISEIGWKNTSKPPELAKTFWARPGSQRFSPSGKTQAPLKALFVLSSQTASIWSPMARIALVRHIYHGARPHSE